MIAYDVKISPKTLQNAYAKLDPEGSAEVLAKVAAKAKEIDVEAIKTKLQDNYDRAERAYNSTMRRGSHSGGRYEQCCHNYLSFIKPEIADTWLSN